MRIEEAIKSKFQSEDQKGYVNLMYTANWVIQQIEALLRPYNLTNEQYNVLRILRGSSTKALCLREITERMINPNCNTTRVVDRLVLKKYVEKKPSVADRREISITITLKGLEIISKLDDAFTSHPPPNGLVIHEWYLLNQLLDKLRNID